MPERATACFRVELAFRDGAEASVCGFCRRERRLAVEARIQTLSGQTFGALREGMLIDHRFSRLLAEAAAPERSSIFLTAACIRMPEADSPCGAILGDLFTPAESAAEDCSSLTLANGSSLRLLLRPGAGAVAFFGAAPVAEKALYDGLAASFPTREMLGRLEKETQGFLWAVDYALGDPVLDGSCRAYLRDGAGSIEI